jgi:PEP-CTERM motif
MRYASMVFAAAVSCLAGISASGQAAAQTITQDFTVDVSGDMLGVGEGAFFDSTSFSLFNPSLGTLTEITLTLTGSTAWQSPPPSPGLDATLFVAFQTGGSGEGGSQMFTTPGPINIDITGTITDDPVFFQEYIGAGTRTTTVGISSNVTEASISTATLDGAITYTYTPGPQPSTIPEPSTWAMMSLGFAGIGFVGYRQTRRPKPQAA